MGASIVIPTRNRVALLEKCLQKLLAQDMPAEELEIIVVDDGSTDETSARVCGIAAQSRVAIRLIKGKGRGPAAARNIGWRAAKAPIILFTDDDCEPSSDWVREIADFLDANPEFGGVGGQIMRLHEAVIPRYIDYCKAMEHPGSNFNAHYLVTANAAYKRSLLGLLNGFDESFPCAGGEDPDLSIRVRARGDQLAKIPRALVRHNHPDSLVAVYRMFHRYGRGQFVLAALGRRAPRERGFTSLRRELRLSYSSYKLSKDITPRDRPLFALCDFVRCCAMFQGYRYQSSK
jgi:glycosyltransferase involved in cell wall biosynthesis